MFDDGISFNYKDGERSRCIVQAKVRQGTLAIELQLVEDGYGSCNTAFILYDDFDDVVLKRNTATRSCRVKKKKMRLAGSLIQTWSTV